MAKKKNANNAENKYVYIRFHRHPWSQEAASAANAMATLEGLIYSLVAAVAFGVQYVPVKKYEIFDGTTFQWFMCNGILLVGTLVGIVTGSAGLESNMVRGQAVFLAYTVACAVASCFRLCICFCCHVCSWLTSCSRSRLCSCFRCCSF